MTESWRARFAAIRRTRGRRRSRFAARLLVRDGCRRRRFGDFLRGARPVVIEIANALLRDSSRRNRRLFVFHIFYMGPDVNVGY
jgi:hypothetical protein